MDTHRLKRLLDKVKSGEMPVERALICAVRIQRGFGKASAALTGSRCDKDDRPNRGAGRP
jgi:hypothetical protein